MISLFDRGPRGAIDELANQRHIWSAGKLLGRNNVREATSISESMPYLEICNLALKDEKIFNKFKSNVEYRAVLEHVNYEQGIEYLELLLPGSSELRNLKFIAGKDLCTPQRYFYPKLGRVSPTQIRYAKVMQDIHQLFGSLNEKTVSEIGVGYGGQAIHILKSDRVAKYIMFDLEYPSQLALKYMSKLPFKFSINPEVGNPSSLYSSDLVISNYAFSELTREIQEVFLTDVILSSKRGYFIYNHIHANPEDSMSAIEFAARIPGAEIFEEIPLTYPGNVLVVWGHSNSLYDEELFQKVDLSGN
jgi:hypothetical protein